ncbi:protein of unknown function [Candidatus Hydrogenisulfobacillus filiaventi]|uniref:Uncharacterized protein n=1 Tax=Candidatus Hydrogenisulfobacillus filiaventi TaxID=2707344 RepID=A0A6F8ZFX9_9FIRM|nr:protein of unknown function [Candidatus Hydrogenisulfobacillus filiaventi]
MLAPVVAFGLTVAGQAGSAVHRRRGVTAMASGERMRPQGPAPGPAAALAALGEAFAAWEAGLDAGVADGTRYRRRKWWWRWSQLRAHPDLQELAALGRPFSACRRLCVPAGSGPSAPVPGGSRACRRAAARTGGSRRTRLCPLIPLRSVLFLAGMPGEGVGHPVRPREVTSSTSPPRWKRSRCPFPPVRRG